MDNFGIYLEKMKYIKKTHEYIPYKRTILYKWNNFKIKTKYYLEQGENSFWKYNYQ